MSMSILKIKPFESLHVASLQINHLIKCHLWANVCLLGVEIDFIASYSWLVSLENGPHVIVV